MIELVVFPLVVKVSTTTWVIVTIVKEKVLDKQTHKQLLNNIDNDRLKNYQEFRICFFDVCDFKDFQYEPFFEIGKLEWQESVQCS